VTIAIDEWRRLWAQLGANSINGGLMNQLVAAYSERHRRYHTLQHLRECLAHADAVRTLARHPAQLELALWFHDAVYDPLRKDNEERSARWAQAGVLAAGCGDDVAQRVGALVLATRHHLAADDDIDSRLMVDIDLSILGSSYARFDEYERQVRSEYAHVDDAAFRAGRLKFVQAMLARPAIYATEVYRGTLEQRARENLQRSLEALEPAG
jgi:predicted metal-dependent HD superfamily phosphohydrolase